MEDKFYIDIDAYFNGIEEFNNLNSQEYNEILKLGKTLADKVVRTISLGYISVIQEERPKIEKMPVPDEYKGKIFDKHGNKIEIVTKENAEDEMYTSKGEKIAKFSDGKIITVEQEKKLRKEKILEVKDPNEINKHACFKVILPSYLPEGYKFDRAEFSKDDKGNVSDKFVDLHFANGKTGKTIFMQQRLACGEMEYVSGAQKIEKVKINGADAVISNDKAIDWEYNKVLYGLSSRRNISNDELIKIGESIK
ncbi:hypothetical protein DP130_00675 [Clostridium tetani]|uniref:DUF4367 domain-containing protein n=1 Tax=Clostridium tetani TaxID=1513 RepID=A0A4Q0VE81_CLOTA|nr:hypothetical protein DP130_00675 [Clostridium tetani]